MNRPIPIRGACVVLAGLLALTLVSGCKRSPDKKAEGADVRSTASGNLFAVVQTSRGTLGFELLSGEAPNNVQNFADLASGKKEFKDPLAKGQKRTGAFYDGLLFHRVVPGFMIQGGDPASRNAPLGSDNQAGYNYGWTGAGNAIADELPQPGALLFDKPCMLAMANHGANTNDSQFFITEVPTGHLEPRRCSDSPSGVCGYVRIGKGICGCDLVAAIARAGNSQTRIEKVTITNAPPTCK